MSFKQPYDGQYLPQDPPGYDQNLPAAAQYPPAPYSPQQPPYGMPQQQFRTYGLRGAEPFWYVMGCIATGGAYFAKLPTKKAVCEILSDLQASGQGAGRYCLNGTEAFWYVLMCIPFGAGYLAKVWAKKALWEAVGMVQAAGWSPEAMGRALRGGPANWQ